MRRARWLAGLFIALGGALIWFFGLKQSATDRAQAARGVKPEPPRTEVSFSAVRGPNVADTALAGASASTTAALAPRGDATLPKPDDDSVIAQIRAVVRTDPRLAERLALEDQQADPDSPDAEERDALLVSAVFNQGQLDRARVEARRYYRRHPGGRFTDYLIRETGARPPPALVSP